MDLERLNPNDSSWNQWYADHVARYVFAINYAVGRRVLDAGTGQGYGAAMLKSYGAESVVAVDIDPAVIQEAKKRYGTPGVEFVQADCETLDRLEPGFDLVCNFENIEHLNDPERFLSRTAKLLRPEGVLLCSTPDRAYTRPFVNGLPANPYHVHEWYSDEFVEVLRKHFRSVELRVQVASHALKERQDAENRLLRRLSDCERMAGRSVGGFCVRLLRKAKLLFGTSNRGAQGQAAHSNLSAASPGDYPIVPGPVATLFGTPWCLFAVCNLPFQ